MCAETSDNEQKEQVENSEKVNAKRKQQLEPEQAASLKDQDVEKDQDVQIEKAEQPQEAKVIERPKAVVKAEPSDQSEKAKPSDEPKELEETKEVPGVKKIEPKKPEKPKPKEAKKSKIEPPSESLEEPPTQLKPTLESASLTEVKPSAINPLLFDKYDISEVHVNDPGLREYLNLNPIMVPHTGARYANKSFAKANVNIIERLINGMMRTEHFTGKKFKAYRLVRDAFEIIAKRTKKNPIQVLVEAIENAAPIEQTTRLQYGGISVPKAVDTSSARRVDIALRNICVAARAKSFKSKKRIERSLADEIVLAGSGSMDSFAIKKKEEIERIAKSAR